MGGKTTLPIAVITNDTWLEAENKRPHREENNTPRRIKRIETESDNSPENEKNDRKLGNNIKTIKQEYYK